MPLYSQCNMKLWEHILVYLLGSLLASVLVYIFYHLTLVSVILGCLLGIYLEKMYADSTVRRRKRELRLQFRTFLESMSVAVRAGSNELGALESSLKDLHVSYREDADIIRELQNIMTQHKNGISLKELFSDFADRSDLEDIHSFAEVYAVIEGRADNIGDVLMQTSNIIGEKIEIEQEIETTITSAKSETYMMLILPIVLVLMMGSAGGEMMNGLFTTTVGHLTATAALVIFAVSYIFAVHVTNIDL